MARKANAGTALLRQWWSGPAVTPTRKRIGWTKVERIEKTGHHFRIAQAGFEAECYLCRKTIPVLARHMAGAVQARAYRSVRDIGDTRMTVRICAACTFPVAE